MRKTVTIISGLALAASLALSAFAKTPAPKPASTSGQTTQHATTAKTKAAPKTDAEMESCIQGKLAASPKLKDQGFIVSVSNGKATFTGTAKNAGSKGSVQGIAKSCGCKSVVNDITVQSAAKTPANASSHAVKPAVKH